MADILEKTRVLLVEDDYEGRAMIRVMLQQIGITNVTEARGGQEAVEYLLRDADTVDIILCDWNMPVMDGPAVLRHVREREPYIPFLMITGRGDIASVTQAKAFGIDGYIRKPFFPAQLEAKIRAVLHKMAIRAA